MSATAEQLSKYNSLLSILSNYGRVAVAFSSGVDSTFLLYAARAALSDNVVALTAASPVFPKRELNEAIDYCKRLGVEHRLIDIDELEIEGFAENPKNRCYICKKSLFAAFKKAADDMGIGVVLEGSNRDDEGDYRPGLLAIRELDIKSPLREADLYKDDIRALSVHFGLPTWDKPSFACLASRFPYGEMISYKKLEMVDKSEQLLLELGFKQFRVRIHGEDTFIARIEVPEDDIERFMQRDVRTKVNSELVRFGFSYVSLDLRGYRTGSMNEVLS
ncbi:MAG: ATP-dependent sacrificial sulfur transferase LarE [Butyrivibrio sp.]|nr:ATP-dependent sacrificial sulfur transferase LarE [Butyrivibrio sp.]